MIIDIEEIKNIINEILENHAEKDNGLWRVDKDNPYLFLYTVNEKIIGSIQISQTSGFSNGEHINYNEYNPKKTDHCINKFDDMAPNRIYISNENFSVELLSNFELNKVVGCDELKSEITKINNCNNDLERALVVMFENYK